MNLSNNSNTINDRCIAYISNSTIFVNLLALDLSDTGITDRAIEYMASPFSMELLTTDDIRVEYTST